MQLKYQRFNPSFVTSSLSLLFDVHVFFKFFQLQIKIHENYAPGLLIYFSYLLRNLETVMLYLKVFRALKN